MNLRALTLPPIIERELRVSARRRATYWGRVGAGAVGLLAFFFVMRTQLALAPSPQAGRDTFTILAGLAALVAGRKVMAFTTAAFAREKREDTLGFLFLTPLRPVDLMAGKLVSSSLEAFYQFLAFVPLLGLPMLLGGVTAWDFGRLVLALVNLLFVVATVGLYFSARAWDEKRAAAHATSWFVGLAILVPTVGSYATAFWGWRPVGLSPWAFSPVYGVWQAVRMTPGSGLDFWFSLLLSHGVGWLLFWATCRNLPGCWRNRPVGQVSRQLSSRRAETPGAVGEPGARARPQRAPRPARGRRARGLLWPVSDKSLRAGMLDENPAYWLALRWRANSSAAWVTGAMGLVAVAVVLIAGEARALLDPIFVLGVTWFVNGAFKLHVATQAGLSFARDRAEDTTELLLATPLSTHDLVQGHLQSIFQPLRPWLGRVIIVECAWMALAIMVNRSHPGWVNWITAGIFAAMLVLFRSDLRAVAWEALWRGVVEKDARAASGGAVGWVLALPWFAACIAHTMLGVSVPWLGNSFLVPVVVLFVVSLLVNRVFTQRARRRLHAELPFWARRRAAGAGAYYGGWHRLGRWLGRRVGILFRK